MSPSKAVSLAVILGLALGIAPLSWGQVGTVLVDTRPVSPRAVSDGEEDLTPSFATASSPTTLLAAWTAFATATASFKIPGAPGSLVVPLDAVQILLARSVDQGISWTFPLPLEDFRVRNMDLATDGQGTWILVAESSDSLGATIGSDGDILFVRSTDDGLTWSAPQALNSTAAGDAPPGRDDRTPTIATDGSGIWVVAWASDNDLGGSIGNDLDIVFARSTDHGLTWSAVAPLPPAADIDATAEIEPDLITDGLGRWMVAYRSTDPGGIPGNAQIRTARSADDGQSWPTSYLITSTAVGGARRPSLASDGAGRWMVAWESADGPGTGTDLDVLASTASEGGVLIWSPPVAVNADAGGDSERDTQVRLASDGAGSWLATWISPKDPDGTLGTDEDPWVAASQDVGATWTSPQPASSSALGEGGFDQSVLPLSDHRGTWTLVWRSGETLGGTIGEDSDILTTVFRLLFAETCPGDADGDGVAAAGDPACPLGAAADCDDAQPGVAPGVLQACDGVNNDCAHPSWPALAGTNEADDDGDGLSECGGDCLDADGTVWALPGEVGGLVVENGPAGAFLSWTPPASAGGQPASTRYDVLRARRSALEPFLAPPPFCCVVESFTDCVESDATGDTSALDPLVPEVGEIFYYEVRAENACTVATGDLGATSYGAQRYARVCP